GRGQRERRDGDGGGPGPVRPGLGQGAGDGAEPARPAVRPLQDGVDGRGVKVSLTAHPCGRRDPVRAARTGLWYAGRASEGRALGPGVSRGERGISWPDLYSGRLAGLSRNRGEGAGCTTPCAVTKASRARL